VSPGCILHASGLLNSTGALIVQVQDTQQIIREQLPWFKKTSGLQGFFPSPCGWTYVGFCTCDTECAKGATDINPSSLCNSIIRGLSVSRVSPPAQLSLSLPLSTLQRRGDVCAGDGGYDYDHSAPHLATPAQKTADGA
jgi:hypothetical protein